MRLAQLTLSAFLAVPLLTPSLRAAEDVGKEVYKKILNSTVYVISSVGTGSGWIYDKEKKIVVTNFHVVAKETLLKRSPTDRTPARRIVSDAIVYVMFPISVGGEIVRERSFYTENRERFAVRARVLYSDPKTDIAFLELESMPEIAVALKRAYGNPEPGERVHTVGNPGVSGALWIYTSGTVRSVYHRKLRTSIGEHEFDAIETSAPLNPGDSGGPVVNDEGDVVALVQSGNLKAQLISTCVAVSEVNALAGFVDAAKSPSSGSDFVEAARALFRTGEYQQAVDKLDRAIELDSSNANAWHLRGSCYAMLLQWRRGIQDMDKAIELHPSELFIFERGLCRYHAGDLNAAIDDFNTAMTMGKTDDQLYFNRGVTYEALKELDWAIDDYTKAIEKNAGHFQAYGNRGNAHTKRSKTAGDADWQRALNDYQKAIQLAPAGDQTIGWAEQGIRGLYRWRDGR